MEAILGTTIDNSSLVCYSESRKEVDTMISLALSMMLLTGATGSQELEYLGWFAGKVDVRADPLPGYYYNPKSITPLKARHATVPVRVKVFDGGSLCPNLTRYKTYRYSPSPLPGYYMLPNAGKQMYPMLPMGWPFKPYSSLGMQTAPRW